MEGVISNPDLVRYIFLFLDEYDLLSPSFVCKSWERICKGKESWPRHKNADYSGFLSEQGYLGLLEWAKKNGCRLSCMVYWSAAEQGHVEILPWADQNNCPRYYHKPAGCQTDEALRIAVDYGQLEAMKWLVAHGRFWDIHVCACSAARQGHEKVLGWIISQDESIVDNPLFYAAVETGDVKVLEVLRTYAHACKQSVAYRAARLGHVEALEWLRVNCGFCGERICTEAAYGGHTKVLDWAKEKGIPCDKRSVREILLRKDDPAIKEWLKEFICC